MSVTTSHVGGLQITTQVIQNAGPVGSNMPQSALNLTPVSYKHFRNTPVKALSSILFLIGILQLCIGIVLYGAEKSYAPVAVTLRSGVYIWGGLMVFVAGGASLTALLKNTVQMIKICMGCNIFNIVVATVGLILYAIQIHTETQSCWQEIGTEGTGCIGISRNMNHYYFYRHVAMLRLSLNILISIFSLLGLVVSSFMAIKSNKILKSAGYRMLG